jgi:organic radical activating enzyme
MMFKKIEDFFDSFYNLPETIPAGIYMLQAPPDADLPYKLHLRVEADGSGILIINASTVLHLNQSASEYAYYLVRGLDKHASAGKVAERYGIPLETARRDLDEFVDKINVLVNTEDLDPVTYLGMERVAPYSQKLSAPYRLDCALTYQVSQGTDAAVAPNERVSRELDTAEWKTVLKNAWEAGIPHVIFTGGEPTLRADLPELVVEAEKLGMVSGLLSDGFKLADKKYAQDLLAKGLDHILLLANAEDKRFWGALKVLMPLDIAVSVHATLTQDNRKTFPALLEKIAKTGVTSISLSAADNALADELEKAGAKASALQMTQVWDLPVPYSGSHPVARELAEQKVPQGAGKAWLYVEPDGDVLPAQGVNKVLGNLLSDPWRKIWKRH